MSQPASCVADRTLAVEAAIPACVQDVWAAFTTSPGAEKFFAPKVNIGLRLQGPYEVFFNPADESQGTKGLKILSYLPQRMLSMQWNAPPHLPVARKADMWVVIEIAATATNDCLVRITHLGFEHGPGWEAAYPHFEKGWRDLLDRLRRSFVDGPVDWQSESMMWKDSANVQREANASR